jgi:hypothetical protein
VSISHKTYKTINWDPNPALEITILRAKLIRNILKPEAEGEK